MPDSLPLSIVIITKNEASRLADCLDSVRWAGEILVVDDESTDETVQIARRYTDRVFQRRMDLEGRHRNWAYAQANNDWVFSLDADERVTPELAREIQDLLRGEPESDVYSVPRRNYIGRRWLRYGGWYPSPQVKLFRRSVFSWEETTVHPRALTRSSKPWGALKQDLIHYSYRDLTDFVGKLNRQTTLEAQKWVQDQRRMSLGKGLWRTLDRFARSFWFKRGYRDRFLGYFAAVHAGLYQFLSFAKYWHLKSGTVPGTVVPGTGGSGTGAGSGPSPRSKLSVVILAYNAQATIPRCLKSVGWADERIVVDGGS
ncbi:MAG: glycosyltransferase, partial [Candidatus Omnitrophica bacterium]|nr:glycosyltransferase [Candidatus Omnitrophota bacterium]